MDPSASSLTKPSLDDMIAKLREPVRLRSDVLPRFVVIMFELALHSFLCSFAACLEEWFRQYRAGHFEPWPDDEDEAMSAARRFRYKMKFPPAAPKGRAGAKPVRIAPEAAPEISADHGEAAVMPIALILTPGQVWPGRVAAEQFSHPLRLRPGERLGPLSDRCRSASVFSAAERRLQNCA